MEILDPHRLAQAIEEVHVLLGEPSLALVQGPVCGEHAFRDLVDRVGQRMLRGLIGIPHVSPPFEMMEVTNDRLVTGEVKSRTGRLRCPLGFRPGHATAPPRSRIEPDWHLTG